MLLYLKRDGNSRKSLEAEKLLGLLCVSSAQEDMNAFADVRERRNIRTP